jgi:hypothetical protein
MVKNTETEESIAVGIINSLKKLLEHLKKDDAFLSQEDKYKHTSDEIFAYLKAYQLSQDDKNIDFDYKLQNYQHNKCQEYFNDLIKEKISKEVIIQHTTEKHVFTSGKHTKTEQREKLESTIKNLCHYLNIPTVDSFHSSDDQIYYRPEGWHHFQSASNTIIELSYKIASDNIKLKRS